MESRKLPVYAAGSVSVPYTMREHGELIGQQTHWAAHSHPTHELLWNEVGASSVTVESKTWVISPKVGLWIPAGLLHSGSAPRGTLLRTTQFSIETTPQLSDRPVAVEITQLLKLLLDRIATEELSIQQKQINETMVLDVLVPTRHELVVFSPRSQLLQPIVQTLLDNPGDQRTLEQWARALNVSARTITRSFRAETGQGFSAWVLKVRAHRAASLLLSGFSQSRVAELMGYSSVSAFGAAFRKATGVTPGHFSQNLSSKVSESLDI